MISYSSQAIAINLSECIRDANFLQASVTLPQSPIPRVISSEVWHIGEDFNLSLLVVPLIRRSYSNWNRVVWPRRTCRISCLIYYCSHFISKYTHTVDNGNCVTSSTCERANQAVCTIKGTEILGSYLVIY